MTRTITSDNRYYVYFQASTICNTDSFRIFDMKSRIEVLLRIGSTFFQFPRYHFLVELLDSDREVIHQTGRALVMQRDQHLPLPQAHDFVGLVLAHHRQSEHLLIKGK